MAENSAKNYSVRVSWDVDNGAYVASCLEIPACTVVDEDRFSAVEKAYEAIEDHLDYCQRRGIKIPDEVKLERLHRDREMSWRAGYGEAVRLIAKHGLDPAKIDENKAWESTLPAEEEE